MKIYVTRHGQIDLNAEYHGGNALLPVGEVLLSELGREQATLLGKKLCKLGFAGKIYASPLLRTMETAELIAKETGASTATISRVNRSLNYGNESYDMLFERMKDKK